MDSVQRLAKKYDVLGRSEAVSSLITTLHRLLGNKRYLNDLEKLLGTLEMSPFDNETLWHLVRDLKQLQ
jgi:hypothetical protein